MGELPSPPNTLFGVPLSLTDAAASELRTYLEDCWRTTAGTPPGDLANDLALLDKFFNPIHVGRSVREALQGLKPSTNAPEASFVDELVILTQDRRRLITPEGRVVLSCLRGGRRLGGTVVIEAETVMRAQHVLLELYRAWSQQRVRRVLLLVGDTTAPPLLPPGLGVLLLLVVNRSTNSSRAIVIPDPADPRGVSLERAFGTVVSAFADAIAPSTRGRQVSLYSAYAITEARRRLPTQLSKNGSRLHIAEGAEEYVVDFVVRQLRRRNVTPEKASRAFDELVHAYREHLPVFAQFGAAHERPAETARIKRRIVDALAKQ